MVYSLDIPKLEEIILDLSDNSMKHKLNKIKKRIVIYDKLREEKLYKNSFTD